MKVVFVNPEYGYPVPSTMGGGVEELLTLLLEENENSSGQNEFYFVQKFLYGKDAKWMPHNKYKNSKLVFIKFNRFLTFIQKAINKILKIFRIKKELPYYVSLDYHNKALKECKKINPDIIIFESLIDSNIYKYQKIFGKEKLYLHLHYQHIKKLELDKYVAGTISVSDFIKKDYEKYLRDYSKMHNFVLKNCVNENRFNQRISATERKSIRDSFGFKDNDFVVIYCGRIVESKGVKELSQSILNLPSNIKLLIVGGLASIKKQTSPYLNEISEIAKHNSEKIKFTGYIKNSDLYKYYQSADLQAVPSLCEEAAGLVVIEGRFCGLPQIITDSGGMIEYASDRTAIVNRDFNLTNSLITKINNLSLNGKLCNEMIDSGLKDLKKFSKKDYYDNFIKITECIKSIIKE